MKYEITRIDPNTLRVKLTKDSGRVRELNVGPGIFYDLLAPVADGSEPVGDVADLDELFSAIEVRRQQPQTD